MTHAKTDFWKKLQIQNNLRRQSILYCTLHVATSRFSYINKLNPILSAFNVGIDDPRVSESQWDVSEKQTELYFKKAVEFLSDKCFRNYVEKTLDEDRSLGEWENRKSRKYNPMGR